jgi:hypothetical protein
MIFCILELLLLIWDISLVVYHFVTGKVSLLTWILVVVTFGLFVTVMYNLIFDIKSVKERKKWEKELLGEVTRQGKVEASKICSTESEV